MRMCFPIRQGKVIFPRHWNTLVDHLAQWYLFGKERLLSKRHFDCFARSFRLAAFAQYCFRAELLVLQPDGLLIATAARGHVALLQ